MYARSILAVVCFTAVTTFLAALPAAAAERSGTDAPKQVIDGEIVYRASFSKVHVDPAKTKVVKEDIPVYSAPAPGAPPDAVEHVSEQLSIYDTKPGDAGYSAIWQYYYVVVPRDYEANTLRSEREVLESGYRVVAVDVFSN
jgi:hypothetical protein